MKLRIRGDSIRLRLTRQEVIALGETGRVVERTNFGDGNYMEYLVCADNALSGCAAGFSDNVLTVSVATELVGRWVNSEDVAVACSQAGSLQILIEKDFACLSERAGEDDSDAFPNPQQC